MRLSSNVGWGHPPKELGRYGSSRRCRQEINATRLEESYERQSPGPTAVIVVALITAFGAILAAVITMSGGQGNGGAPEAGPTGVEPTPPGSSGTAEPQQAVMLADLQPVDGETLISTEPLSVNGMARTRPISFDLGCFEKPQAVTYQLGREYGRFDAVIGQSDA